MCKAARFDDVWAGVEAAGTSFFKQPLVPGIIQLLADCLSTLEVSFRQEYPISLMTPPEIFLGLQPARTPYTRCA